MTTWLLNEARKVTAHPCLKKQDEMVKYIKTKKKKSHKALLFPFDLISPDSHSSASPSDAAQSAAHSVPTTNKPWLAAQRGDRP